MIRYKELYRSYLAKVDKARKELASSLQVKEEKFQREILYQQENVKKANIAYVIALAVLAIFASPIFNIFKGIGKSNLFFIYIIFCLVIFIAIFVIQMGFKKTIKELSNVNNDKDYAKEKEYYQNICDEIYKTVIFIICINEYYYDLIDLDDEELILKWKQITNRRKEAINASMNYNINTEKYRLYFEDWLKSHGDGEDNE